VKLVEPTPLKISPLCPYPVDSPHLTWLVFKPLILDPPSVSVHMPDVLVRVYAAPVCDSAKTRANIARKGSSAWNIFVDLLMPNLPKFPKLVDNGKLSLQLE